MDTNPLSHAERLRLEAFAMAHRTMPNTWQKPEAPTLRDFFEEAEAIEAWLRTARERVS